MTTEAASVTPVAHPIRRVVVLVGTLGGIYSISQSLRNSVGDHRAQLVQSSST